MKHLENGMYEMSKIDLIKLVRSININTQPGPPTGLRDSKHAIEDYLFLEAENEESRGGLARLRTRIASGEVSQATVARYLGITKQYAVDTDPPIPF